MRLRLGVQQDTSGRVCMQHALAAVAGRQLNPVISCRGGEELINRTTCTHTWTHPQPPTHAALALDGIAVVLRPLALAGDRIVVVRIAAMCVCVDGRSYQDWS